MVGDVIKGVKAGWFGFEEIWVWCCDGPGEAAGGEMTGDEYEDMIAVIERKETEVSSYAYPEIECSSFIY